MKTLRSVFFLSVTLVAGMHAGTISITFDNANQSGLPGQTLQFFGTVYNTGGGTVFLNSDSFSLALSSASYTLTDDFGNVPLSLDGNTNSGDIELFDVALSSPVVDPPGQYGGTYGLVGGVDGNAQDNLAQANFTITLATPEPGTFGLLGAALAAVALCTRLRVIPRASVTPDR